MDNHITHDPAYDTVAAHPSDLAADLFPTLRHGSDSPDVTLVAFGGMLPW